MIAVRYRIAQSAIPGAGKGVFIEEDALHGAVIIAPDAIPRTLRWDEIVARPDREALMPGAIRWFEEHFTVTPDWPDAASGQRIVGLPWSESLRLSTEQLRRAVGTFR